MKPRHAPIVAGLLLAACQINLGLDIHKLGDGGAGTDASTSNRCGSSGLYCGGGCVNTTRDAAHCGGCDQPCTGGACVSGSCIPNQCDSPAPEPGCTPFAGGSPDSFGYTGCRMELTPTTLPCPDISLTGTVVDIADDGMAVVPIGFEFDFYGAPRSEIAIHSNGGLRFDRLPLPAIPTCLGSSGNELIAVWWQDLDPSSIGTVSYQTLGTAPNRQFVVRWNAPLYDQTTLGDFTAVLGESTGNIDLCYRSTPETTEPSGAAATFGIRGASAALEYSCRETSVSAGTALHFEHPEIAGSCESCEEGLLRCDGVCVDPYVSTLHCGRCGVTCRSDQACRDGACGDCVSAGRLLCDGVCVDAASDPRHCGQCGTACGAGEACGDMFGGEPICFTADANWCRSGFLADYGDCQACAAEVETRGSCGAETDCLGADTVACFAGDSPCECPVCSDAHYWCVMAQCRRSCGARLFR